ncbi:hypothetical protein SDC9_53322 [bioreactor metagenome]|uniref:Uncharacterized protein n=1 Tax=bioreactor metagenome TaxID=1076179 RepID=A0A644WU62_9ZZZZ
MSHNRCFLRISKDKKYLIGTIIAFIFANNFIMKTLSIATFIISATMIVASCGVINLEASDDYQPNRNSQNERDNYDRRDYGRERKDYAKDNFNVYYRGYKVEGASVMTFSELGGGYGKDSFKVYFQGRVIEGASASTFTLLGERYAKDAWKAYYNGKEIKGASSQTFETLGRGYAKDAWKVYYRGEEIRGTSPSTFRIN